MIGARDWGCYATRMVGVRNPLLAVILAALSGCTDSFEAEGCMVVAEDATTCPARKDVAPTSLSSDYVTCGSGNEIADVNGEGAVKTIYPRRFPSNQTLAETACCYPVTIVRHGSEGRCGTVGRPFFERGELRSARLSERSVAPNEPSARATAWSRAGAGEHASVAAFARLALELMALGAPTSLLREVQRAALDEVGHAETCWEFARRFGLHVEVGAFPFTSNIDPNITYHTLAVTTAREGCLTETLGAHLLAIAAAEASEPEVKGALERMAREEAEHAALAYRVVAWAMRRAGAGAKAAVREVLSNARVELDLEELALRANVDVMKLQSALERGLIEVVRPATAALFAA